jgi:hypothetical protein
MALIQLISDIKRAEYQFNIIKQFLRFVSSVAFLCCLSLSISHAVFVGVVAFAIQQCIYTREYAFLGFDTNTRCVMLVTYASCLVLYESYIDAWLFATVFFIASHVLHLMRTHGMYLTFVWFLSFVTNPISEVVTYYPSVVDIWSLLM